MENQNENKEVRKYTNEELTQICNKLVQENKYLKQEWENCSKALASISRLDYLLKIIESDKRQVYGAEFIIKCRDEVDKILFPVKEKQKEE